jgi:hypothetical protein
MLEELARDVTGWGAHAVAFFELLAWTQNVNHVRVADSPNPFVEDPPACDRVGTVNLRNRDALDGAFGPFEVSAHTIDVRLPNPENGRYNVTNAGFFLWRLQNYPVVRGDARPSSVGPTGFHFSPLGHDAPLFTNAVPDRDETGLATELNVPGPIRPLAFCADVSDYRRQYAASPPASPPPSLYVGEGLSLALYKDGAAESLSPLVVCPADLSTWKAPPQGQVAVDVARGRIAFDPQDMPKTGLQVSYCYGFSGDVGGGPYDRRRPPVALGQQPPDQPDFVRDPDALGHHVDVAKGTAIDTIQSGISAVARPGVVNVTDSRSYAENLMINLTAGELVIQAANQQRPVLLGDVTVTASSGTRLRIDGLWIAGRITVTGDPLALELAHCTVVPGVTLAEDGTPQHPGQASLSVDPAATKLQVTIERCVTGPLQLPAEMDALAVSDSVIDSPGSALAVGGPGSDYGPPSTFEQTTVFGPVRVKELTLASDVIFTARVAALRRQTGCVRFSHVPDGSETPRRYRCQPDLALEGVTDPTVQALTRLRLAPQFTARRYGLPGYAQLTLACADEIRTGAESGSEMGAFEYLMQPQREANLLTRLDEYLPAGLTPALIFVT